jgi:hypothetical protein
VQAKAWDLLKKSLFSDQDVDLGFTRPVTQLNPGFMMSDGSAPLTIPRASLMTALSFTATSARTAKYDASIRKRWCKADLSVSYDLDKVDQSTVKYPASDPEHVFYPPVMGPKAFVPESVSELLDRYFNQETFPSVFEYAVQVTDDGNTYITLEPTPAE